MARLATSLVTALGLFLLSPTWLAGSKNNGSIEGYLRNADGTPVRGFLSIFTGEHSNSGTTVIPIVTRGAVGAVVITGPPDTVQENQHTGWVNSKGFYRVHSIPAGHYYVRTWQGNRLIQFEDIDVQAGQTLKRDFVLPKDGTDLSKDTESSSGRAPALSAWGPETPVDAFKKAIKSVDKAAREDSAFESIRGPAFPGSKSGSWQAAVALPGASNCRISVGEGIIEVVDFLARIPETSESRWQSRTMTPSSSI